MRYKAILLFLTVVVQLELLAQGCPNIDFSNGDYQGWTGTMTNYSGTIEQQGTPPFTGGYNVGDRFTLFNQSTAVPDPFTCNNVLTAPPNGGWCVKLGNEGTGCKQDYLEYTVSVSPNNNLLLYQYAIVLEDPGGGHAPPDRPRFIIEILEKATGNLVDATCGVYEDYAGPFNGLRTCGSYFYRAWTTTGIDLTAYQNLPAPFNEITIRFKTHDCGHCGHFGYAYVTAECTKLELETTYCENANVATVRAPDGFSYQWNSGEFSQEILIQNPAIGQEVGVTLTSKQGCTSYITTNITSISVVANFSVPPPICELDSIAFVDLSHAADLQNNAIAISEWQWIFGDGDTSNLEAPNHLYTTPGVYTVKLNVTADGCTGTKLIPVVINPQPIADFTFSNACVQTNIGLQNTSSINSGNLNNNFWDFGDNTTSSGINPAKNYASPGQYEITLISTSDSGCVATKTDTVQVYPYPVSNFTTNQFCFGKPTQFTDATVSNADSTRFWLWNYGDNTPLSTLQNNTHLYQSPGVYAVSLTVTNANNCVNLFTDSVTIVDFKITASTSAVCLNQSTSFNLISNSPIQSILWDFDDSNTSTLQNPAHLYSTAGYYNVSVNATNTVGCKDSTELIVLVNENPLVEFDSDLYAGCTPLCINITNYSFSNDSIVAYDWLIANKPYTEAEPSICFEDTGYVNFNLNVTNIKGCSTSLRKDSLVYVAPYPVANFTRSDSVLNFFNTAVTLTNTSILYDSIYWKFYDNSIHQFEVMTTNFPEGINRKYPVCLYAITDYGCIDSICKNVTVKGDLFYIPNSFTPDGNHINDSFRPVFKGLDPDNYSFYIYDRWGELLFYTEDLNAAWDGTYKGNRVKTDVYVWKIVFNALGVKKQHTKHGHVSVIYNPALEE